MSGETSVRGSDYSKPVAGIIPPEGSPPFLLNLMMGGQHVLAMFGATVLGPLLMGFDPNTSIFFSGVATLVFYITVGGRIPSYLGSSFSFIAAVVAATGYSGSGHNPQIPIALGGIMAAGLAYGLVGVLVSFTGTRWINAIFPPTVTGVIVGIIGLNLAHIAVQEVGSQPLGVAIGLGVVLLVGLTAAYAPGFLRRLPILVGAVAGYAAYLYFANAQHLLPAVDFAAFNKAAWFGIPSFQLPSFSIPAILLIAPVFIILVAENLGHVKAIGGMTGRDLDPYLGRAFIGDGVATIIASMFGGAGVTTYAENMGTMRITSNFSSRTMIVAGVIAIGLGLSPKFGALIGSIPLPVLGGLAFAMFGIITATAGSIWQRGRDLGLVDFDDMRTLLPVGIALVIGAGDLTITVGRFAMGGIINATLAAIILYHGLRLGAGRTAKASHTSPYKS